jgi:WD40 repeat protein
LSTERKQKIKKKYMLQDRHGALATSIFGMKGQNLLRIISSMRLRRSQSICPGLIRPSLIILSVAMSNFKDRWAEIYSYLEEVKNQLDTAERQAWRAEREEFRAKQMLQSLGAPITPLLQHAEGETVVAYSPDGRQIARGGFDGKVWLSDLSDGQRGASVGLEGHKGWVLSVVFSPDGRQIASGGTDRTVRLWDAKTGAPVGPPLRGHKGWVLSVAFSPDGRQIASGGTDRTVRLWDAKTGAPVGSPLEGHMDWIWFVGYDPDSLQIIGGNLEGKLLFWRTAPRTHR